jgi:hypothetical protein
MMNYLNEYTIILLIIIFILISKYDIKYILLIIIIILIIYIYSNKLIVNDIYDKNENIKYNNKLSILFDKLEGYKNLNLIEYKYGIKYWIQFISNIKNSNDDNILGYSNYYNNTELYLNTSIKHFKSLTIKSNNKLLLDIINDIYKEGYILLKDLSKKYNKKWEDKPNTLTNQIIFNQPKPHNISFI